MKVEEQTELTQWLDTITRELPGEIAGLVRDELAAHYEDAISEQLARGTTPAEAHRAALRALGDSDVTGQMLKDVHLAEKHYRRAALASVISPLTIPLILVLMRVLHLPGVLTMFALNFSAFLTVLYVLHAFRLLLIKDFNFNELKWSVRLLSWGVGAVAVGSVVAWWVLGHPLVLYLSRPDMVGTLAVSEQTRLTTRWLSWTVQGGTLLLGAGFIVMGDQLFALQDSLFGLRKPLLYALIASGFSILCLGLAAVLGVHPAVGLAGGSIIIAGLILQVLITLLFLRASQRRVRDPFRLT
jgi:hypothetical protein